jgi:hypothetical protein
MSDLFKIRYQSVTGLTMWVRDFPTREDFDGEAGVLVKATTSETGGNSFVKADAETALALVREVHPSAEIVPI